MRCCLGYCVVPDRSSVRCFARAKRLAGKIYSDITCNITSLTAQYALTYALTLDLPLAACWNTCRLRIHSVSIIAYRCNCDGKQCESKNKNPPPCGLRFSDIFPNGWEFLISFSHTCYTFLSTLEDKFLFNYVQL